jgi:hypothetical protein
MNRYAPATGLLQADEHVQQCFNHFAYQISPSWAIAQ